MWFKNTNGIYFKANTAFYETVGKEKLQVEGRDHYFVWDVDPHDCSYDEFACPRSDRETLQTKDTLIFDEQIKTPRGMRQFKTYKSPLFDTAGNTMGTVGVANDVTDLGNIATQMDILINSLPFSVVVEDTQETILNMNSKTEEYFNVKQTEVLGGKISTWRRKVFGDELASKREKEETNEFTVCINDVCKTLEFTHVPIVDVFGNITGKLRIYRDITSERELEAKATLSARTDYLTGLYNRRYFYEYLNLHRDKSPLTLVSLDLNGFKEINDRYGHAAGDEALVKVSQALQEAFPQELVTRWGGDEFVVALMGDHSAEQVSYAIAEVLDQLKEQAKLEDSAWSISASVGIAQTNDPLLPIDEVIRRSDDALYHSKRAGGKPHIAEVQ